MTASTATKGKTVISTKPTKVIDGDGVVVITRTAKIRDLEPGDILPDGRIVEGVITGDGGSIVSFEAHRSLLGDVSVAWRTPEELEVGDELIFQSDQTIRTVEHVGGTGAKGTSVLFRGDDEARLLPTSDGSPVYAIVVA